MDPLDFDLALPAIRQRFRIVSPDTLLRETASGLRIQARGPDPFVTSPEISTDLAETRLVRVRADLSGHAGHHLKVYYSCDGDPGFSEAKSLSLPIPRSPGPTTLDFDFSSSQFWLGEHVQLRFDLERFSLPADSFELQRVVLVRSPAAFLDLLPPAVAPRTGESFHVMTELLAQRFAIEGCSCSSDLELLESPHPERLRRPHLPAAWKLRASRPGIHRFALRTRGDDERVTAELWARDALPAVATDSLTLGDGLVTVRGIPARARAAIVPVLALSFNLDDKVQHRILPLQKLEATSFGICLRGARHLDGGRFAAALYLDELEEGRLPWRLVLEIPAAARVTDLRLPQILLGNPESCSPGDLALIPGVALLDGAAPPAPAQRFPVSWKLTWPCVYLEQSSVFYAVWWDADAATPHFMPCASGSGFLRVVNLHLPERPQGRTFSPPVSGGSLPGEIRGELWIGSGPRGHLLTRLARRFLPTGGPGRDPTEEILDRSLRSMATTFRGREGLTVPQIGGNRYQEYFDPRSFASLLLASRLGRCDFEGSARREVARFALDADSIPLEVGLLLPEYLTRTLASYVRRTDRLRRDQRADGGWPPRPAPGCHTHAPEALAQTASAIAVPTAQLLEAHFLGLCDDQPIERSLARLRCPGLLPTGGQFWEFSPAVPDLLAIGHLAEVWLLAAESGLDPAGFGHALDWLALGLTFIRLHDGEGEDARRDGACIPALGVTRAGDEGLVWYMHAPEDQRDWRGVSCPWVGLRFAEMIEIGLEAARRNRVWPRVATQVLEQASHRILLHAGALQQASGGLPDGYLYREHRLTEETFRVPLDLAVLALTRRGAPTRAHFARHGRLTAVGVGTFRRSRHGLLFRPSAPGPQALLVHGVASVDEGGVRRERESTEGPLGFVHIEGVTPVLIEETP